MYPTCARRQLSQGRRRDRTRPAGVKPPLALLGLAGLSIAATEKPLELGKDG